MNKPQAKVTAYAVEDGTVIEVNYPVGATRLDFPAALEAAGMAGWQGTPRYFKPAWFFDTPPTSQEVYRQEGWLLSHASAGAVA